MHRPVVFTIRPLPERPVLVEPEERPSPAPFRIKLGQVMHLNGTVPKGRDLSDAVPKRCARCGALFIVFGKGSARAKYCADCRAKKCPSCNGLGGAHYPYCSWVQPHPCKGCGVERPRGIGNAAYCETCQAQQCPECRRYAGQHGPACLFDHRQRRAAMVYHGVVTEQDILALYLEAGPTAIRHARRIVRPEAEDVVQDVVVYLLEKRDYLKSPRAEPTSSRPSTTRPSGDTSTPGRSTWWRWTPATSSWPSRPSTNAPAGGPTSAPPADPPARLAEALAVPAVRPAPRGDASRRPDAPAVRPGPRPQ